MRAIFIVLLFLFNYSFAQEVNVDGSRPPAPAFKFEVNELVTVDVNREYTSAGIPVSYSSHLETDVCSDGLCKPVSITIKWDLLGNFLTYHTDENHPLTKFDHIKLTEEDHKQLHKILSDTASIIRDYQVEDMIDTSIQVKSLQIDAVTSATSKTFEGVTVEGALYTVYTLWHFINGDVRKKILEYTRSHLSDSLIRYMIHSDNRNYVSFIFENITASQKNRLIPDIIALVLNKDTYIPHFAIAQLTDSILENHTYQHTLLKYLTVVNIHVQNVLLERFKNLKLDSKGVSMLAASILKLRGTQSAKAFSIIENNRQAVNADILQQLKSLADHPDKEIVRQAVHIIHRIK